MSEAKNTTASYVTPTGWGSDHDRLQRAAAYRDLKEQLRQHDLSVKAKLETAIAGWEDAGWEDKRDRPSKGVIARMVEWLFGPVSRADASSDGAAETAYAPSQGTDSDRSEYRRKQIAQELAEIQESLLRVSAMRRDMERSHDSLEDYSSRGGHLRQMLNNRQQTKHNAMPMQSRRELRRDGEASEYITYYFL